MKKRNNLALAALIVTAVYAIIFLLPFLASLGNPEFHAEGTVFYGRERDDFTIWTILVFLSAGFILVGFLIPSNNEWFFLAALLIKFAAMILHWYFFTWLIAQVVLLCLAFGKERNDALQSQMNNNNNRHGDADC